MILTTSLKNFLLVKQASNSSRSFTVLIKNILRNWSFVSLLNWLLLVCGETIFSIFVILVIITSFCLTSLFCFVKISFNTAKKGWQVFYTVLCVLCTDMKVQCVHLILLLYYFYKKKFQILLLNCLRSYMNKLYIHKLFEKL